MPSKGKNRGTRPSAPSGKLRPEPSPPSDLNDETPKFCLNYLRPGFDVHALDSDAQAAFAKTLQKLASSKWKDLITAPRHGQGSELIHKNSIKAPIPGRFQDQEKFLTFRYKGKLPMSGVRVGDVYHILWIEPTFGQLYDHG